MDSDSAERRRGAEAARRAAGMAENQRAQEERETAVHDLEESLGRAKTVLATVQVHLDRADRLIAARRKRIRLTGHVITVVGASAGLLLIWIDSTLEAGFLKEFLNALGTGALTTGTIGFAASWVGPMLRPEDKENEGRIITSLKILTEKTDKILIGLSQAEVEYRGKIAGNAEASRDVEREKFRNEIVELEQMRIDPNSDKLILETHEELLSSAKARVKQLDDESESDPRGKLLWFT